MSVHRVGDTKPHSPSSSPSCQNISHAFGRKVQVKPSCTESRLSGFAAHRLHVDTPAGGLPALQIEIPRLDEHEEMPPEGALQRFSSPLTGSSKSEKVAYETFSAEQKERFVKEINRHFAEGKAFYLGRGGSGRVYRIPFEGKNYAIKVLNRDAAKVPRTVWREFETAPKIASHASVVHAYFSDKVSVGKYTPYTSPCLVMEYLEGSPLSEYMYNPRQNCLKFQVGGREGTEIENNRSNEEALMHLQRFVQEMASACDHLQSYELSYRDFKESNVMVYCHPETGQAHFKLIDLGLARDLHSTTGIPLKWDKKAKRAEALPLSPLGTKLYMAPEIHDTEQPFGPGGTYTEKVDIWSFGVTLYHLATGQYPHTLPEKTCLRADFSLGDSKRKEVVYPKHLPSSLVDMIKSCLQANPTERPSWQELLRHPFLSIHPGSMIREMEEQSIASE